MKPSSCYTLRVLATGFLVLVFFSLPLFWVRFFCENSLAFRMPSEAKGCRISPSGLVPDKFENDPNVVAHSRFYSNLNDVSFILSTGIFDFFTSRINYDGSPTPFYFHGDDDWTFIDKNTGLIMDCTTFEIKSENDSKRKIQKQLYIGPEGISEKPDKALGKFKEPIISRPNKWDTESIFIIFDQVYRRFYLANLKEKTIRQGPPLTKDDKHKPVQFKSILKGQEWEIVNWSAPSIMKP